MNDVIDSKEGARLLLAYEQVGALFDSQGNNGVQREHLLLTVVLHCKESEETLQNVLKTRLSFLSFIIMLKLQLKNIWRLPKNCQNHQRKRSTTKPGRAQLHIGHPKNKAKKRSFQSQEQTFKFERFTGGSKRRKSSLAMSGTGSATRSG